MARLYANENFPLPVVTALRSLSHDVLTVGETGKAEQAWPDEDVLEFAHQDDRALLTFNRRHFIRLHGLHSDHSGIIVCTYDPDFPALASRINAAFRTQTDLQGGSFELIDPVSRSCEHCGAGKEV